MFYFFRTSNLEAEQKRINVEHEQEVRSLVNKHEANIEFLKQEANLASVKVRKWTNRQHIFQVPLFL